MGGRLSGAILAAGQGQRLRSASGGVPKALVDLGGRPLLLRQIDLLIAAGASPIHVIVSSETYLLMQDRELRIPEKVELLVADTSNSMESLLRLGEQIAPGFFLLMGVDTALSAAHLRDFVTNATKLIVNPQTRIDGVLAVVKWRGDIDPLFTDIGADRMIMAVGQAPSATVTAGVYLLSSAVFGFASEARSRGLMALRRFLALLLEKGVRFTALELPQAIDIDNAADLNAAREMIAREAE